MTTVGLVVLLPLSEVLCRLLLCSFWMHWTAQKLLPEDTVGKVVVCSPDFGTNVLEEFFIAEMAVLPRVIGCCTVSLFTGSQN